jgi:uncharacterized membrane protein
MKNKQTFFLIIVILLLITSFCAFMVNYTEYKYQKEQELIIKNAQKTTQELPKLLMDLDKYKQ